MQKQDYAAECAISGRPFTVFRWRPGTEARYKKTVVCREIALAKNVCQVCLLDLDYGIPVQARDAALGREAADGRLANSELLGAKSDVNIEFQTEQIARRLANGEDVRLEASGAGGLGSRGDGGAGGKQRAHEILSKMARKKPYYNKNKTAICTFWLRNVCTRADCPYRPCNGDTNMPELTSAPEMRAQNIKDRYYGTNDPVAEKMLRRNEERELKDKESSRPPEDASIATIYVGGIDERVTEETLRDAFYAYGELKSVKVILNKKCAFVTFVERAGAEAAVAAMAPEAAIANLRCRVMWGKPATKKTGAASKEGARGGTDRSGDANANVGPPGPERPFALPFNPPNGREATRAYPSTDPKALGAREATAE
jgi:pre-mRNA-splicing factor RBM22/SLT11